MRDIDPSNLARRLSRKIETGKSIQLKPEELDLLVVSGAYATLSNYAAQFLLARSRARLDERAVSVGEVE